MIIFARNKLFFGDCHMKKYLLLLIMILVFFNKNSYAFEFLDGDAFSNKLYSNVFDSDNYLIMGGDIVIAGSIGVMSYLYSAPFGIDNILQEIADKNNFTLGSQPIILNDHENEIYEDRWILFGYTCGFSYLFGGYNDTTDKDMALSALVGLNAYTRFLKIYIGCIGRYYSMEINGGEASGGEDLRDAMLQPYYSIKFDFFNISPVLSLITSNDNYINPYYITGTLPVKFTNSEVKLNYTHIKSIDSISKNVNQSYTRYSLKYILRYGKEKKTLDADLRKYFMLTVENVFNNNIDTPLESLKNDDNYVFRGEFVLGEFNSTWGFPVFTAWTNTSKRIGGGIGYSFFSDYFEGCLLFKIRPISETIFIDREDNFEIRLSFIMRD